MAPYRSFLHALAVKIQVDALTDALPTAAANAVRVVGIPTIKINDAENPDRADAQHYGVGEAGRGISPGEIATIEVTLELAGKGSVYAQLPASVAEFQPDPFFRAAGFGRVFNAGKVTYTDADIQTEWLTAYAWTIDGRLVKLIGCTAKPKLSLKAGGRGTVSFTLEGRVAAAVVEAAPAGLVLPVINPAPWSGDTQTALGAWTLETAAPGQLVPRKLDIDFGTETVARPWAGAGAHLGYLVTQQKPKVQLETEPVAQATFDPYAIARESFAVAAPTNTKLTTRIPGGAGNTIEIVTGNVQLQKPEPTDAGGAVAWKLEGGVVPRSSAGGRMLEISVS